VDVATKMKVKLSVQELFWLMWCCHIIRILSSRSFFPLGQLQFQDQTKEREIFNVLRQKKVQRQFYSPSVRSS